MRLLFLILILVSSISCRKFVWDNPNDTFNPKTEPASLKDGLIVYHRFTGDAKDESGNNYNGIQNKVSLDSDRFGDPNKAFLFNGIDSYITIGLFNNPIISNNTITLSFWVKTSANNNEEMVVIGARGKGPTSFSFQPGTQITCTFGNSGGGFYNLDVSTVNVRDNKWHHIVMIYNGSEKILYVDNVLLSSTRENIALEVGGLLEYGRDYPYDRYYKGLLDDIRIYNRVLTIEEITYLANN